ncbi:oxidoreductase [Niabella ginsenosidivorans]|uniref:Oxidoreductase n=1 Tax=Niabella ginsenosidivorans TaxID=1176587 RepID=A0A1A9IAH1_9BACT|nr:oxidoreductase [Niabella ginsenosidivorans]ANH83750.1 oxidoreductase [Niabella ginsenosidivorans]
MSVRFLLIFLLGIPSLACAQVLEILEQGKPSNLRGIGIYKKTVWASGSNGYVGRSDDNGHTWAWQQVAGYENKDFRDIQVLDSHTALLMAIESPAYILKTADAGSTWKKVYENKDTSMFLDAMAFADAQQGYVIGDPLGSHLFMAATKDGGNTWGPVTNSFPPLLKGEAFFAASGTNIAVDTHQLFLVSGGAQSRLMTKGQALRLPIMQGTESTGANSIGIFNNKIMVAGGDFSNPRRNDSVLIFSNDGGKTWQHPALPPGGYRSAVAAVDQNTWITCGLTGVEVSKDGGLTWQQLSVESFNAISINKAARTAFLAGSGGRIAKVVF